MPVDVYDDIELEKALVDKRHRELLTAIKNLSLYLKPNDTKDNAVLQYINTNKEALNLFLLKLQELSKQPEIKAPILKVEIKEVVDKLSEVKEIIDRKEWVFTVERTSDNRIKTITAKPK